MAEIRELIVDALVARMTAVTVANGYLTTVTKVERGYRDPTMVKAAERPWVGIIPMREDYTDKPGRIETLAKIALTCYITPDTATLDGVTQALSDFTKDIRKAVYQSPANLDVPDVHYIRMLNRQGTEGLFEAARTRDGTMLIELLVKFSEDFSA